MRKARRAAAQRGRRLRIMFTDEARFGRMNRPRPCWAPASIRPEVASQLIREYIYLYGAVSPKDGMCVYLIMPTSNTACFQTFLNVLSRRFARQDILLVLDGAPNHRCGDLAVPDNISLLFLPPYSPELNPKENLWDEIREKLFKNYALKSIDAVRRKLEQAILYIERNPETVKSITFLETGFGASCGSSDFNMITEISDAVGESGRGFGRITASEVFSAEVLVAGTITQHVIDGCQDRRGNRDCCLLGAVARFETEELGLEIAVLLARCAPRSLHQYGLEPGCSLPNPR